MHNGKIYTGQVGARDLRGEGDMIPIHMKIDILAVFIFYEKPVGSTLRAQQIAFFHVGLLLFNNKADRSKPAPVRFVTPWQ